MKRIILKIMTVVGLSLTLSASAQQWQVTMDEFGNGSIFNTNTLVRSNMPGVLMPDPSGGIAGNVLVYTLPNGFPAIVLGDVVLNEPNGSLSMPSDLLRAMLNGGKQQIIFYSDESPSDPADAPADTGLPMAQAGAAMLNEVGPEAGPNGVTYRPGNGDIIYFIQSDSPAPVLPLLGKVVLGLGMLGVGLGALRTAKLSAKAGVISIH
jgi:hypothetical protein